MTRDEIIHMAREAGLWMTSDERIAAVERFAALVAAHEREACAKVCEKLPNTFKIAADEFGYTAEQPTAENYAAAIRARGET
jgi:hypothetical protein